MPRFVVQLVKMKAASSKLEVGLQGGRLSSSKVISRTGKPTISLTFSRCRRRLVLGEIVGGGIPGAFNFTVGVRGLNICDPNVGVWCRGDEDVGSTKHITAQYVTNLATLEGSVQISL
jgi:hypothetical protein